MLSSIAYKWKQKTRMPRYIKKKTKHLIYKVCLKEEEKNYYKT